MNSSHQVCAVFGPLGLCGHHGLYPPAPLIWLALSWDGEGCYSSLCLEDHWSWLLSQHWPHLHAKHVPKCLYYLLGPPNNFFPPFLGLFCIAAVPGIKTGNHTCKESALLLSHTCLVLLFLSLRHVVSKACPLLYFFFRTTPI